MRLLHALGVFGLLINCISGIPWTQKKVIITIISMMSQARFYVSASVSFIKSAVRICMGMGTHICRALLCRAAHRIYFTLTLWSPDMP